VNLSPTMMFPYRGASSSSVYIDSPPQSHLRDHQFLHGQDRDRGVLSRRSVDQTVRVLEDYDLLSAVSVFGVLFCFVSFRLFRTQNEV